MPYELILKLAAMLTAFMIIVRFLFSSDGNEHRNPEDIRKEIDSFRGKEKEVKHYGKLMDDMIEEYYRSEGKR